MTEEDIRTKLQELLEDTDMITKDAYTPNAEDYPDGRISFIDHHLAYLKAHKNVNPAHYISNLELMIKKR